MLGSNSLARQRSRALGQTFSGDRDLYADFGYDKTLTFQDYKDKYDRQDIAARVVDAPANTTWKNPPKVTDLEEDDETETSPFIEAFNELSKNIRLWHYMRRADRLSGIGNYGVLLIGIKGSKSLDEPVEENSLSSPEDIIFLSVFTQKSATIKGYDGDMQSEHFGRPNLYQINLGDAVKTVTNDIVHHSRIIHIAENKGEDEVKGEPRLKKIYNRLDDLEKVMGASAETYWLTANRGLHINALDEFDFDDDSLSDLDEKVSDYIHKYTRVLQTQGVDIDEIGQNRAAQPGDIFDNIIALIAGKTGIPQRILLGSERGELASSQDQSNYYGMIEERQTQFAEPEMVRPFVDRLIDWRALPEPEGGDYSVIWPDLFSLTELEQAEILATKAKAVKDMAPMGATDRDLTQSERREFLGLPPEKPEEIIEPEVGVDEYNEEVQRQFDEMMSK